jgi:hypothetical protein
MVSITLSVPEDLKSMMDEHPEINWSAVAREAIKERLVLMERFKAFAKDSELTEDDALELGKKARRRR